MENFKITRDGKYDRAANLQLKIRNAWPKIETRIDAFFTNH